MLDMCDDRRLIRGAVVAIAAALFVAGCSKAAPPPRTISAARIPVTAAATGSVTPQSTLGGLIVPFQNVQIVSTLVEPVNAVYVVEGDRVHKGQVLAQLDTKDLQAQLLSLQGTIAADEAKTRQTVLQSGLTISQNGNSINAAQATLRQVQQTLANDTANLNRNMQLMKQGYLSQQAYDNQNSLVTNDGQAVRSAQVALQNLQTQVKTNGTTTTGLQGATVEAVRADEQIAQGQVQQVRVQIAKAAIVSPIDGVVVNRNLNPGEYPGTRQLFTLQQTDKVYAVLNGSGAEIVGVQKGSPVRIVASDRNTMRGMARVSAVLDQVTPGSTNFIIKAVLANPTDSFRSGMVVTGVVSRPTTTGVMIPRTAFNDDTQTTVQTIVKSDVASGADGRGGLGGPPAGAAAPPDATATPGPDGTPPRRRGPPQMIKTIPVVMVAEDGKNAVVQGLQNGQTVVINGQLGLSDGQPAVPCRGDECKQDPRGGGARKVAER
jgi:multidrug efflux pump subunit AcrA (membrane-fusion protein)